MNSYGNLFYMIYNAFSLPFKNTVLIDDIHTHILYVIYKVAVGSMFCKACHSAMDYRL